MLENVSIIFVITVMVLCAYTALRPFTPFSESDYNRMKKKAFKKGYFDRPRG